MHNYNDDARFAKKPYQHLREENKNCIPLNLRKKIKKLLHIL